MPTGLSNTNIYYFVCISGSLQAGAGINRVPVSGLVPSESAEEDLSPGQTENTSEQRLGVKVE